ncbi:Sensors of blue-light using FAD [Palleronia marisminoris]|uniref:Sensors of blue-light using FAD n=1 Tax=Palleronia marisminoris TaxID=315423 RepID=A0A1Y5RI80_9RHOB|nr:BLUF domain-containing protein [Palleronia marisminoris]SFG14603.1 Sensors of blue-light using FAD [Palleronia marisminoris]SLN15275.1 Sensors of blue-light using FAD [Palleronia marisminoris]
MLRQIFYCSVAEPPDGEPDVAGILEHSRRNNPALGLTGMLTYADGVFAQILEGDTTSLDIVLEVIRADPRHSDVRILSDRMATRRLFSDWSMLHVDLDAAEDRPLTDMTVAVSRSPTPDGIDRLIRALAYRAVNEVIDTA